MWTVSPKSLRGSDLAQYEKDQRSVGFLHPKLASFLLPTTVAHIRHTVWCRHGGPSNVTPGAVTL